MNIKDYYSKKKSERDFTSQYLIGKKFNTQSGDKEKQIFYVKLLPRIPDKPSEFCEGPFYEFWVHRNCGPDKMQALTCLNRNRDEFKSNKRKCPACLKVRKIMNNESDYSPATVERAKEQKAQNRIIWAVYDLSSRMEVQYLEISNKANDSIMNEFQDNAGEFLDLTQLNNKSCLQITRTGAGLASNYSWRGLIHDKFVLKNPDGVKIKSTYKYPEDAVKFLSLDEFKQIFDSAFEVETSNETIDDVMPEASGSDDLDLGGLGLEDSPPKKETAKKTTRSRASTKSDDDLKLDLEDDSPKESKAEKDDTASVLDELSNDLDNL